MSFAFLFYAFGNSRKVNAQQKNISIFGNSNVLHYPMKKILIVLAFFCALNAVAQDDKVWRTPDVDTKPDLAKGMYTLRMFVADNFQFPELKNKKVTVFTSFIIEPDGSMTDRKAFYVTAKEMIPSETVKIQTEEEKAAEAKALEAMKTEASRVLALFQEKWIPAQVAGKPVRCLYNYPITFALE